MLIEELAIVGVVLEEEILVADAYPIEGWLLAEEGSQLLVIVLIDRRDVGIRHTDGCREQADVVEHIGIVLADELRVEATHRQTSDGTAALLRNGAIGLVDEFHDLWECGLEAAFHRLWQAHRWHIVARRSLQRSSLHSDVAIGHHHNHRLCLALCNEVVEHLSRAALGDPSLFIATNAMQQIEYRVAFATGLIACWGIDRHTAIDAFIIAVIPDA